MEITNKYINLDEAQSETVKLNTQAGQYPPLKQWACCRSFTTSNWLASVRKNYVRVKYIATKGYFSRPLLYGILSNIAEGQAKCCIHLKLTHNIGEENLPHIARSVYVRTT